MNNLGIQPISSQRVGMHNNCGIWTTRCWNYKHVRRLHVGCFGRNLVYLLEHWEEDIKLKYIDDDYIFTSHQNMSKIFTDQLFSEIFFVLHLRCSAVRTSNHRHFTKIIDYNLIDRFWEWKSNKWFCVSYPIAAAHWYNTYKCIVISYGTAFVSFNPFVLRVKPQL
jgi:hypothetical protein